MSGRGSNDGSVRSERSYKGRGKGRDPIYDNDAWYQGRDIYREERDRREDARYRGNAWNDYSRMPRGPRNICIYITRKMDRKTSLNMHTEISAREGPLMMTIIDLDLGNIEPGEQMFKFSI